MAGLRYEVESQGRFVGLQPEGVLPDETTVMSIRNLYVNYVVGEKPLKPTISHPPSQGCQLENRTYVETGINTAPSSTKDRKVEGDAENRQASKPTHCYFGLKTQVGVDAGSDLALVKMTPASVSDLLTADALLTGFSNLNIAWRSASSLGGGGRPLWKRR